MDNQFAVIGISHISTPVEIREKIAPHADEKDSICRNLADQFGLSEVVVLATCSRFEVYGIIPDEKIERIKAWMSERAGRPLTNMLYWRVDREAVRHLLHVTAGMDSWVVGETEILAQVKAAYLRACEEGTADRTCHLAFQRAMHVGRKIRNETRIVGGIASIGGAASILARRIFTDLKEKTILVYGAGTMAESTVRHLIAKGVKSVLVSNRSLEKAERLAEGLGGTAITLEAGMEKLTEADIAVVSTGAESYLIDAARAEAVSKRRGGKPLFIIDIALPRNVDPAAADVPGIYLYDLDHLRGVVKESLAKRRGDIGEAEEIATVESADLWGRVTAPQKPPPGVLKPRAGRFS